MVHAYVGGWHAHCSERACSSDKWTAHCSEWVVRWKQRITHSGERMTHSSERTAHSGEWTTHSLERTGHSGERTIRSSERTVRCGEWMTHSPEWTIRCRVRKRRSWRRKESFLVRRGGRGRRPDGDLCRNRYTPRRGRRPDLRTVACFLHHPSSPVGGPPTGSTGSVGRVAHPLRQQRVGSR